MNAKAVLFAGLAAAAAAALMVAAPADAHPTEFGINLPWIHYGSSFGTDGIHGWGSSYNGSTVQPWLDDMKSKHLNIVRVWINEDFQGLQFSGGNPNNAVTGVQSSFITNVKDFVSRANGDGLRVYITFLNFADVKNYPNIVTTYKSQYINNGMIPVVKALQPYNVQYDLCNEVNLATGVVSWSNIRSFASAAVSAMRSAGNTHWVTMTGQNPSDFINYLSSTFGGLGFNFYDCHCYSNSSGPLQVLPSNVGNVPLFVGEYGPTSGWANYSQSTDQSIVDNFCNDANSKGYYGALAWSYLNDGSGYGLQNTNTLWTIEYYGNLWGIN